MLIEQARKILADGLPVGPRMDPCVCGAGRHAHGGRKRCGGHPATGCRRYRIDPAYALAVAALDASTRRVLSDVERGSAQQHAGRRKADPKGPGEWSVGPCDVGRCRRQIMYRERPPEGFVPDPSWHGAATMGGLIHDAVASHLARLYPWQRFEQPLSISGLDRASYRYDRYDPIIGVVTDVKTASDWAWAAIGDDGPSEDVWGQLGLYGLGLTEAGEYVTTLKVVYLHRDKGMEESFRRPYDPAAAERTRDALLAVATSLDLGQELPRDRNGPDHDAICRSCFARSHCWNLPRATELGVSPVRVTILGEEPDLAAIGWAAAAVVEHRTKETEHKKSKEYHADMLDGLDPGTYGDYEARRGRAPGTDWKSRAETLEAYYASPPDERPPLDSLPMPRHRSTGKLSWARRRKAKRDAANR